MKTRLLILIPLLISVTILVTPFAEKPINCTFGDQTTLESIFEKVWQ